MSAIFISHSSRDNQIAGEIRDWLADQGHRSVFLDFDPAVGIPAGRDWEQELYRKIRACRAVIVLCSRHSMASKWCFMEITHARALGKHLFPVKIDDCDVEGVLTDRQVIDLTRNREKALERLGRGILASGLDPADAFDWDGSRPPYPGLLAFQEEDAAIFFGRDDEVGEGLDLVNRVRRLGQTKLVMVLGASGTGKSSLVRAGLLPRVRRDSERWLMVDPFRPRDDPARELATVLSRAFDRVGRTLPREQIAERIRGAMARVQAEDEEPPAAEEVSDTLPAAYAAARTTRVRQAMEELEAALREDADPQAERYLRLLRAAVTGREVTWAGPAGAARTGDADDVLGELADDLRRRSGRDEARVLLVIDQFEELLGHGPDHPNSRFLRLLRASLDRPACPLLALGTMRSDFLGSFQKSPALLDVRYESLSLGPLSSDDVAQVIEKPAQLAAIDLEPGLVQALVDDAESEDTLPLLAFTLRELNERYGEDALLEIHEYRDRLGGLHGAVAKAADEILEAERVDADEEANLRTAFLALVRMTEDGTYARRTAHWDELPEAAHPLLERFVQGRLLVAGGDGEGRTLEVAHEALFRSWDRLVHWLDESAEALRLRHEIQYASGSWEAGHRAPEDLWRGGRLARSRELIASGDLPLEKLSREFVEASHRAEQAQIEAEEARRRRTLRAVAGGALVALALAAVAVVLALQARAERTKARAAQTSAELGQVEALISAAVARLPSSQEGDDLDAAVRSLRAGLTIGRLGSVPPELRDRVEKTLHKVVHGVRERNRLEGHRESILAIAASPDGSRIGAVDESGLISLWARSGRRLETIQATPGWVHAASFDRDLSRAALLTASTSPDGSVGPESIFTLDVWDLETRERHEIRQDRRGWAWEIRLTTDGEHVATRVQESVRWWDLAGNPVRAIADEPLEFETPERIRSADGKLAIFTEDKVVVSPSGGGGDIEIDTRHGYIGSWTFMPDGSQLVTAGRDGKIRIWDFEANEPAAEVLRSTSEIWSVSLGPSRIATGEDDGAARLRTAGDASVTELAGPGGRYVPKVVMSPDEQLLAVVGRDRIVRLWSVDGRSLWQSQPSWGRVVGVGFRATGDFWLATSSDDRIRFWDQDGNPTRDVAAPERGIFGVSLSPDGSLFATVAQGGKGALWDWEGNRLAELQPRPAEVIFRPDGKQVASAGTDGFVRLWDLAGKELASFPGYPNGAMIASFSPAGDLLATAGLGGIAKVWNVETHEQIAEFDSGRIGQVFDLTFSPDGRRIAMVANDQIVRLWRLEELDELIALGCDWLRDYLQNSSSVSESDRSLCDGIGPAQ